MELYKKYRPKGLDQVWGCPDTVNSLKGMLANNRLPHAILLHGPSGCGKTTIARILKEELDCHDLDFREVNASSFRGIDSIRDIQQVMNLAPMAGTCRVWLLDECHKYSADAMNAMLKILEDTPAHVYFFLCTTDPDKLIKAILTRCCEMPVRALNETDQIKLLQRVAGKEDITLTKKTTDALVLAAQGSARTLLVLLDKISNLKEEDREAAIEAKLAEDNEAIDFCRALIKKQSWPTVAGILKNLKGEPEAIRWVVMGYARAVLLNTGDYQAYLVLECFKNHFYDSKAAGLAFAAYEAIHAK